MIQNITKYCKESYYELVQKCTWPTLKELTNSAVVVLSASVIIALLVFGIDQVFEQFMRLIYSIFN